MSRPALLQVDEPSPVEVVAGGSPFVIVCDHAGRALPRSLGDLGVSATDLTTHIAWDLGAAGVARRLAAELDATLFLQRYSRLVIDCNRPLSAPDSIPEGSGGVDIPGNQGLDAALRTLRAEAIFAPYHTAIERALQGRDSFVLIAVHSFTPELHGVRRPFHAGVLYERDSRLAAPLLALLRQDSEVIIGDNEPYAASAATDYAIMQYGERRGAPYVELEVRQDLIADDAGQAHWAKKLSGLLRIASEPFRL